MQLLINVPTRAQIVNGGFQLVIAPTGTEWLKSQLGDYANKSGVYILHANGKILYVGKTTKGEFGTFAERLRRHCQEKAAGNSVLHRRLRKQSEPVRAYLIDLEDLDMMIDPGQCRSRKNGRHSLWNRRLSVYSSHPRTVPIQQRLTDYRVISLCKLLKLVEKVDRLRSH